MDDGGGTRQWTLDLGSFAPGPAVQRFIIATSSLDHGQITVITGKITARIFKTP